jgi:hypothetical protein
MPANTPAGLADLCYVATSGNRGESWTNTDLIGLQGAVFPTSSPERNCEGLVKYGPDGTLYYLSVDYGFSQGSFYESDYIATSTDGGRTFTPPHRLYPNQDLATQKDDIPSLAVDQRSGRVYVAWTRYGPGFSAGAIDVASSIDHGATFTPPVTLNNPDTNPSSLPKVAVGPDGAVYVVWQDAGLDSTGTGFIRAAFASSRDHASSFSTPTYLVALSDGCLQACYDGNYDFSAQPVPDVAVSPVSGTVVVAVSGSFDPNVGPVLTNPGPVHAYVLTSNDGGTTFSAPQVVGVPPGLASDRQFGPAVMASDTGRFDISYYDRSSDGSLQNTYLTSSLARQPGLVFDTPVLLSSQPSPTWGGIDLGDTLFNDENQVYAGRNVTFVVWPDSRRTTPASLTTGGTVDVVFARVPAPPSGH